LEEFGEIMKRLIVTLALSLAVASIASATTILVSWDSSALAASSGRSPFQLDFGLNNNGTLNNNTITLSNFTGATVGAGSTIGGATFVTTAGQLSTVTLTDSANLNYATIDWTPGALISFTLSTTDIADSPFPDGFQWGVFDNTNNYIGTTGIVSELLSFDLGPKPTVNTYGHSASESMQFPAPTATLVAATPEPTTWLLVGMGGLMLGIQRRFRR
jgi:PEP-CTERM motif